MNRSRLNCKINCKIEKLTDLQRSELRSSNLLLSSRETSSAKYSAICLKDVSYVATCPIFFFATNSLSEVLRNRLLGKRLVQKALILESKKWTLEWEPLLGFHLNSYYKPETTSILEFFFGTQK